MCMRAIQLDPKSVDGYNNLGVCFQRVNQHENALRAFKQALKLAPWNPLIHANVGNAYLALQQPNNAKEFYEQALKINPNDRVTTQRLQQILSQKR